MPGVGMLMSTDWVKTGSVLTIIMWTMPCSVGSLRVRAKYSSKWLIGPTADSQDGASPCASGLLMEQSSMMLSPESSSASVE